MQIESEQSLAVVDDYTISFKEKRARQNHAAPVDRRDRRPRGDTKIESLMRALNRSVENALDPEYVGDGGVHRGSERTSPLPLGRDRLEDLGLCLLVLLYLALGFGIGRGITRGDSEQN